MNKTYQRINWQNEPSIATPLNEVNLNKVDYSLNEVDNRVITLDTTKANQSDLLQTVKTVTYNTTTGVFTFEFWNGTTVTADLNIEKIPVSFSMSPQGVITMTTADGTQYTADVSELIKTYSFVDSTEIDFTVETDQSGNKNVTASIKAGSITGEKLQPNYLADCVTAKNGAESAAGSASSSATSSELSSEDSEAWAVGERNGQPVPSTDPAYENNAKWWAQHGTGSSFAGLTDTNFTNLQNGQIAKYDSATQMWINTEDEGGLLPHFKITSEAGSTVTVVCPDTSVIVPTQTSSGIWQCDVPAYGVYTVHAVINGDDAVRTVTVDTVKEYVIHDEHYSYTLNVYAPTGSSIIVTDGDDETYTGTGAGSTAVVFALHQASTLYHITVTYDGLDIDTTITSSATSGQSGNKTITFGTINLTVDEDLIGETIVMAKGTDTVSKVASSTSMVFYPNATGNWRISVDYEGETVYAEPDPIVVSSLSTPVSAELSLVKIPEGATVLPTDDIQTWLACANITDKSYTTLAEVLADRETFETLIADSNACDYMARSTSWTGDPTVKVPTMTSDTAPSGHASADSVYQSQYSAYKAFDGDGTSQWVCGVSAPAGGSGSGWIQYEFPNATVVNCMECSEVENRRVTAYTLKGSNDGTTFTAIISGESFTKVSFINTTAYKYYRLELTCKNLDTSSQTYLPRLYTLQFYNEGITTNQDAMALIGKYDYCSNALLSNATWAEAIANSDYFEEVLNVKVPVMTSNTTPSGEVIYSSIYSSTYEAYKAFDKNSSTSWTEANNQQNGYVGYIFTNPVKIYKAVMDQRTDIATGYTWCIKASNDGDEYITVSNDFITNQATGSASYDVSIDTNGIQYSRYILYNKSRGSNNAAVAELQFYGRKSSSVSNTNGIIHTAMGNESVYCVETGDTFTATDGIATVDFSQFDEGVYTFGSTTAKNPDNLSQDYTKQFRITKSPYGGTTELYLMPDAVKTLYWWGYMSDDCEEMSAANGWSNASGYSYKTPTYNTNSIAFVGAPSKISGVGMKTSVPIATLYSVTNGSAGSYLADTATKTHASPHVISTNSSGVMAKFTSTVNGTRYAWTSASDGGSATCYALWYE